jgi:hypothetical protein
MGKVYEVTDSTLSETVDFGDGKMDKYVLALKDEDGNEVAEVQQWKKAGQPGFLAGATIEGEIKNQPRGGLKLTNAREVNGSAPTSNGASSSAGGSSSGGQTGGGYVPENERQASIERQVALKAASEQAAAVAAAGKGLPEAQSVIARAEAFAAFLGAKPAAAPADKPAEGSDDDIPF